MARFPQPVVLWRLRHPSGDTAFAVVVPQGPQLALVWFRNDRPDGTRDVDSWPDAVRYAHGLRDELLSAGFEPESVIGGG